jgi:ABC-2 type transport system ATP-binding protein
VLRIDSSAPRQAKAALEPVRGVSGVAQIGNALRVLYAKERDVSALEQALAKAGVEGSIAEVPANLEDVFVVATHALEQDQAA